MNLYEEFAKFNIDTVGVTDASLYNAAAGTCYKQCIVALFPYFCGYSQNSNISIYAHGRDYHLVTRDILLSVAHALELEDFTIHSDIGPEIERRLAINAGLCFKGVNHMCINPKYGSYFFIGYIACNTDFELSRPLDLECVKCMKCVEACPGRALGEKFCEDKCLSAITQKKGELEPRESELIRENGYIFGCDICQKVCPHNLNAEHTPINEFKEDRITNLSLNDLSGLTNKTFRQKYGDRAFAWRGKSVLKRNIKITEGSPGS